MQGIVTCASNTDVQALAEATAQHTLQLGPQRTKGLGAGGAPEVGFEAAKESEIQVLQVIQASGGWCLTGVAHEWARAHECQAWKASLSKAGVVPAGPLLSHAPRPQAFMLVLPSSSSRSRALEGALARVPRPLSQGLLKAWVSGMPRQSGCTMQLAHMVCMCMHASMRALLLNNNNMLHP